MTPKSLRRSIRSLSEYRETEMAIDYRRKSLLLDTSEHSRTISLASLGSCFYDLGIYDSALYYLKKISPTFKLNETQYWPFPHLYLGKAYNKENNSLKALLSFRTAYNYAVQEHFTIDLCKANFGIAETYKKLGNIDSAFWYAKRSLQIAESLSCRIKVWRFPVS